MSAPKTLFQKIADKEIPAKLIHEDAVCVAFHDISPQAPTHVLIVPRKPIPRVAEATVEDQATLGHLLLVAGQLSRQLGLAKGFRVVINNGHDGGETVPHLHVHLLGGRPLDWPPG
jgi:histidine triad (HIT) family protein